MQSGRFRVFWRGSFYFPDADLRSPFKTPSAERNPPARLVIAVEMIGFGRWIFWECKNNVISRMAYLCIQKYGNFYELCIETKAS
ncbi:MAG: hypothetical protein CVU60_11380 [Deltaproteobacteria bacterium HGW-Deltaproteobacteria-18]|jgi:hypothetical protein|nr:MAG: hypothetical protein CVU60_11380 [Deltaproteobacteria bacterium HGW-Deltaproteobacteria-18]